MAAIARQQLGGRNSGRGTQARPPEQNVAKLVRKVVAVERLTREVLLDEICDLAGVGQHAEREAGEVCLGLGRGRERRVEAAGPVDMGVDVRVRGHEWHLSTAAVVLAGAAGDRWQIEQVGQEFVE